MSPFERRNCLMEHPLVKIQAPQVKTQICILRVDLDCPLQMPYRFCRLVQFEIVECEVVKGLTRVWLQLYRLPEQGVGLLVVSQEILNHPERLESFDVTSGEFQHLPPHALAFLPL